MSSQPKVLRAAVVVDDKLVDEIHQRRPEGLVAGRDYRSDALLFGRGAPRRHRLFRHDGERFVLDLPLGAKGTVWLGRRSYAVEELRRRAGGGRRVRLRLPASARGRLEFGDSTLLFQFAPPRVESPHAPFPRDLRPTWEQLVDRTYASILGGSLVVLGAFFTYLSTLEFDPTVDLAEIDERFLRVMGLERPDEEPEEPEEEQILAQEEEKQEPDKEKEPEVLKEKPQKFSEEDMAKARGVGIARVLGTYGGPGMGTVFDVIQSTENQLGELFAQGMTTTVLADGGDISPFVPGGTGVSAHGALAENEGLETGDRLELAEKGTKLERKVTATAATEDADVYGDVDKRAVLATLRQRSRALQHCYEKSLRSKPGLQGKMTFTIAISVMGAVTSVAIEEDTLGDPALRACAKAKISGWRFPIQGATEPAEVTFPVLFSGAS